MFVSYERRAAAFNHTQTTHRNNNNDQSNLDLFSWELPAPTLDALSRLGPQRRMVDGSWFLSEQVFYFVVVCVRLTADRCGGGGGGGACARLCQSTLTPLPPKQNNKQQKRARCARCATCGTRTSPPSE